MVQVLKPKLKSFECTMDDYSSGRHHRIDVVMHERDALSVVQTGVKLTSKEYDKQWATLRCTNTWGWAMEVIGCPVCQDYIADCKLSGRDPFQPPKDLVERMRKMAHHFRSQSKVGTWLSRVQD